MAEYKKNGIQEGVLSTIGRKEGRYQKEGGKDTDRKGLKNVSVGEPVLVFAGRWCSFLVGQNYPAKPKWSRMCHRN
jgi:hypothetical protein